MLATAHKRLVRTTVVPIVATSQNAFQGSLPSSIRQRTTSVTSTKRFQEIYHNTDSIDGMYEKASKGRERFDPSKRAYAYILVGAQKALFLGAGQLIGLRVCQYMNPARDIAAAGTTEYDVAELSPGQCAVIKFRGKPCFVLRRSAAQQAVVDKVDTEYDLLRHPEYDRERVVGTNEYTVCLGVCTHLGCLPAHNQGFWQGFFCPCHGSHYDPSGRIMKGPAPENLEVPKYKWTGPTSMLIGS